MPVRLPKLFLLLLGIILVLNLLQAHFTELIFDEAYYWHYAQNMAWGYFDHPPMVALLVKIGSFFFKGELGIRFMSCLLSVATITVLWLMIDDDGKRKYITHFFVLVFSMTLMNAYGFFTLPDTPLLFFTALFLLIYKRFIQEPSYLWGIILGVTMAALMYSKYHAVLVILFVLLSNLRLLTNKFAWFAVGVALLCYIPHFLWLYENDFVSIRYHLFDRPNGAYDFEKYTLGFLINLVAIFGLTFPWIYKAVFKTKSSSLFTKALLYLTYGVLLFFFLSSFNRRVQTQWIIVVSIPMAVLVFQRMLTDTTLRKWIYRTGIATIVIILFLRIGLIYKPFFPVYYETHGNRQWVSELQAEIGDIPVIFENSYRNAPMYAFYSGNPTFSLNTYMYRRNQYSIDDSEEKLQGKKVLYVSKYIKKGDLSFTKVDGAHYKARYIRNFESFRKLEVLVEKKEWALGHEEEHLFKVYNPYDIDIDLKKLKFSIAYLNDYKQVKDVEPLKVHPVSENILSLKPNDTLNFSFMFPKPKIKDPGYFRIGISENKLPLGLNGKNIKLE
ncbi:glycosyltransferase family 39 protein [Ulvibacterium sp.]|uniref:ArnT family glycosyltransferase n=1 Tax=Ulvibacterium sp. TaxID=2665914 RepID=UPI00260DF4FF|nr:glycosyltransferase family 39 protein [Ulvibacterium sp.]